MSEKLLPNDFSFEGPYPRLNRRLRLGIVGGGRIAATQGAAARMTNCWDIVAGALSSDPVRGQERGAQWYLDPARCYASFAEMAKAEAARSDGVDAGFYQHCSDSKLTSRRSSQSSPSFTTALGLAIMRPEPSR